MTGQYQGLVQSVWTGWFLCLTRRPCSPRSGHSVPLENVSETQLTLCSPERQLLPLALAHCHYTLRRGGETDRTYDLPGIQAQLARRFLAGKPLIQADTSRYLNRALQDFSVVLQEVRDKIPQVRVRSGL
ncbi:E3 ubiquitin-protein ligase rnf213-beta [Liparis tanakae]|uniref:E3 ubiquitin-protein ligase rnf213-beta n=1 Tax=Liparis tanakae TaxID=230148 RepID=A0A4Z2E367_9TELE|nr:E3 ubiquitin-protein ligase rnf213-beta [Liparis tanakae]